MRSLLNLAQETGIDDDGGGFIDLPASTAEGLVWAVFLAVVAALWISTRRRRDRAEADYWERRAARDATAGSPPASADLELGIAVGDEVVITSGRFDGSVGAVEVVDAEARRAQVRVLAEPRPLLIEVAVEVLKLKT